MTIAQTFATPGVHLSCEVFPPKAFEHLEDACAVVGDICQLNPAYVSVTYGAAGNTQRFTREISAYVLGQGVQALSHLTCVNATRERIGEVLTDLKNAGISNVLALRGDLPDGMEFPTDAHFKHANELICAVREHGGFCVGAACYPEGHPEAPDRDKDLDHLKLKQDAGADFLTTQMFFDNTVLYQFLFRALKKGITLPVTAGVMPVVNAKQIRRIMALSGASLPQRFMAILDRFGHDPASMEKAGIAYATDQIIDLIANGVNHVHLYTMNRPDVARAIFDNLGPILRAGA